MAEKYIGRVVRVSLAGGSGPGSERMLAHLLDQANGVVAYFIDAEERVLTAYLDESHSDDEVLVRALMASGMYPKSSHDVGVTDKDGTNAC